MATPIIDIKGLHKQYGTYKAVDNLDLQVQQGEIFGLLGPNGAGKSTTILMMMGLSEASAGHISIAGIDPQRNPIDVKKVIGYLPDNIGFYEQRSGLENLELIGRLNGLSTKETRQRAHLLFEKVGLQNVMNKKVGAYSRGMKQRLGLAETLIKKPKILILDEPTLGLDPNGVKEFLQLIQELNRQDQLTVLLASHHLHQVEEVCNRVGLFVKGKLVAQGTIQQLADQLFAQMNPTVTIETNLTDVPQLENILRSQENVIAVDFNDNRFIIQHTYPNTLPIVEIFVKAHVPIHSLFERTYGLDDIYSFYFKDSNI
ncbi:ABC transporter ATP-binding protein [Sphingobacterium sp. SGG-5]|uniref:ABC transporter ATP-binding protein n=1 Tax=Sphingobacterium sp. SGG-5 TaxID=2710881 RepID=UPI0013EC2B35|nr:ABC transporter ATP-binding protein [Sphingobacterium sp. SGG-5]NGM62790.1 ABC transporter ATP-binding protein [Sphingobacterium sp. SGG-5]